MMEVFYRKCSGLRLLLPTLLMLAIYLLIEVVELLSPFSGYGDTQGYYEISTAYAFFGLPLLMLFACVKYEISLSADLVLRVARLSKISLLVSCLGLAFLAFDRIFIQGVDYSGGISAAREGWREIATSRGGVSSGFSVLGNLMYPLVFLSIIIVLAFYDFISNATLKLVLAFLVVIGFSLLVGGRTSILVFLCSVVGGVVVRFLLGFSLVPGRLIKYGMAALFACVCFSGLIFYWRMLGSTVSFESYAVSLVSRHNGYVASDLDTQLTLIDALLYSLAVYFVHVKWISQAVLADAHLHGQSFMNQVFWILQSRGGLDFGVDFQWTYSGRWISLPGSVWHDYGIMGVLTASAVMHLIASLLLVGFTVFNRIPTGVKISLVIVAGAFFAFFVVAPFSSMMEVVEFIYFFFMVLLMAFFYLFRCVFLGLLK